MVFVAVKFTKILGKKFQAMLKKSMILDILQAHDLG